MLGLALALMFGAVTPLVLGAPAPAASPILHHVVAGGPDSCAQFGLKPGCDKNYRVDIVQRADGSVSGTFVDGLPPEFGGIHARIDCLVVVGNQARFSGVVVSPGIFDGEFLLSSVQDNGTSANDPVDRVGRSMIQDVPFDCTARPDVELLDMPQGQVSVG